MDSPEPTRAIYARMPPRVAEKLDRAAAKLGLSKRDLLATLVNEHLDIEGDALAWRPRAATFPVRNANEGDAVLDLAQAADLLRVSAEELQELAEADRVPGRRIGTHWRFSRQALLQWLRGDS